MSIHRIVFYFYTFEKTKALILLIAQVYQVSEKNKQMSWRRSRFKEMKRNEEAGFILKEEKLAGYKEWEGGNPIGIQTRVITEARTRLRKARTFSIMSRIEGKKKRSEQRSRYYQQRWASESHAQQWQIEMIRAFWICQTSIITIIASSTMDGRGRTKVMRFYTKITAKIAWNEKWS